VSLDHFPSTGLSDNEFHLYLPISTIRNAMGKS
jgi:hypothetical protein